MRSNSGEIVSIGLWRSQKLVLSVTSSVYDDNGLGRITNKETDDYEEQKKTMTSEVMEMMRKEIMER